MTAQGSHRVGVLRHGFSLVYDDVSPPHHQKGTIVLVHGGCLSGSCYHVTADGRPGWVTDFVDHGYRVIVPDWPGVGRSSGMPAEDVHGEVVVAALGSLLEQLGERVVLLVHSMSGPYGFQLLRRWPHHVRALVAVAPGPPGELQGVPHPSRGTDAWTFSDGERSMAVPDAGLFYMSRRFAQEKMVGASTQFPSGYFDTMLNMSVGTPARCVLERLNFQQGQLRLDDDTDFRGARVLVVTGELDADHSFGLDSRISDRLAQLGAQVDHVRLHDHDMAGNGHLMMLENNSSRIADLIAGWIPEETSS